MENKLGKSNKRNKSKKVEVKSDVRLYLAHDVIWMLLNDEERHRLISAERVTTEGLEVETEMGVDKDGDMTFASHSWDWRSVALDLGFDKAELVIDPTRNRYVLLYNKEKIVASDKA
jgi:hypothetical protein